MNDIQILEYNNQPIRQTETEDGEILFCASDIAASLGYKDARDLSRNLDEPPQNMRPLETEGGVQNAVFYTEAELYEVLIKSRNERCKPFRKWVTHEVLPSIRKNGYYNSKKYLLPKNIPESIVALAQEFSDMKTELDELKPLAHAHRKTLRQREEYRAKPRRKYDVEVRYSNGRQSWIRTFPIDIAVFLKSLHSPKEVGKILEEANSASSNSYIRDIVIPRYKEARRKQRYKK